MEKLEVNLPVLFFREGENFIAYTPALDLSTSAESFEQAKKRFGEVVHLFFEEIIKKGTLEQVLADSGWEKPKEKWQPPVFIGQESQQVSVFL